MRPIWPLTTLNVILPSLPPWRVRPTRRALPKSTLLRMSPVASSPGIASASSRARDSFAQVGHRPLIKRLQGRAGFGRAERALRPDRGSAFLELLQEFEGVVDPEHLHARHVDVDGRGVRERRLPHLVLLRRAD